MLKKVFCQLDIDLILMPVDPILIRSGHTTVSGPDIGFVRTYRNGKSEVYLPGSSLKGVIRSHSERICRTLKEGTVCIPYINRSDDSTEEERYIFCGEMFKEYKNRHRKEPASNDVYKYSCPACRTFGSTSFVGRFSISDAYAEENAPQPEQRDGVAIDRFSGGAAKRAKFELEVVTRGEFKTHITMKNFELWQLGLVAYVLKDFEDEIIRIGAGKSRGLGRVKGKIDRMTISYFGPSDELKGLESFLTEREQRDYGIFPERIDSPIKMNVESVVNGMRHVYNITELFEDLVTKVGPIFSEYIKRLNWYNEIVEFCERG